MENQSSKMVGQRSVIFNNPPCIMGYSSVAGKKEKEGPLGCYFEYTEEDPMFGGKNWEDAESRMQKKAAELAIQNAGLNNSDIRYLIAGDLLGQLIATSFGIMSLEIPMFGVYGACSTMGESMSIGSILVEGGFAKKVVALTSSHFAGSEKQFRFPLAYGNQRPLAASWTVTGSGAVVIAEYDQELRDSDQYHIFIKGVTTGIVVDYGIKDSMNMGACMAPAACDVIFHNMADLNVKPDYYDKIITGDLGQIGSDILLEMMKEKGYDISSNHMDCGIEIFDKDIQDTHSGGSGCGCSAITLTGYVMEKLKRGDWKRVLFVPTGALLSPVSFNEGNSVPGIAHGVILEVM